MTIAEEIKAAYAAARNYPELVEKLIYAGVRYKIGCVHHFIPA